MNPRIDTAERLTQALNDSLPEHAAATVWSKLDDDGYGPVRIYINGGRSSWGYIVIAANGDIHIDSVKRQAYSEAKASVAALEATNRGE